MIAEPMTTLTDYAIALQTLLFALLLPPKRAAQLWAVAFACVSLAAFLGGTYHGFAAVLALPVQRGLWQGLVLAMGLASCLMVMASAQALLPLGARWGLWGLAAAKLAVYLWVVYRQLAFGWVVVDYLSAMALVLGLHLGWGVPHHRLGSLWIAAGVGISLLAAALLGWGQPLGPLLPVDLYHLVQMVALGCFYWGVRRQASQV